MSDFYPLQFIPVFDGKTIFATLDYIVSNIMMPLGGVLVALLAGWGLNRAATQAELAVPDTALYRSWRVLVRYVVPLAIAAVFIVNL